MKIALKLHSYFFTAAFALSCTSMANANPRDWSQKSEEDKKTANLKCYEVGYRYGYTAMTAMKGGKTNPAWDFIMPERCRLDQETNRGIKAGTRSAW